MLRYCFFLLLSFIFSAGIAQKMGLNRLDKNGSGYHYYRLTDTTKAILFYNEISLQPGAEKKNGYYVAAGFSRGTLSFQKMGTERTVRFDIRDTVIAAGTGNVNLQKAELIAKGVNVTINKNGDGISYSWSYPWKTGVTYKVMITALPDSATRLTIYSGYILLPETGRWKFLASVKAPLDGDYLRGLYANKENLNSVGIRLNDSARLHNAWIQRSNGSWLEFTSQRPVIDLTKNADSAVQAVNDRKMIIDAVIAGKIDTTGSIEGVYYKILKEGTGDYISVNDTVTVFYKGSLLSDGSIFDQTKDNKAATFPLKRLIRGWQVAVPKVRVGGAIRIFIPSALAYTIRSRSKDIPPNSVLVFDIEVLSVKK